ncbi:YARHG domain-containing protein [Sporosarcina sp. PTS2304]|uniref:YARHG domain-containing protein n=1 Tax=Sporosarcina sp. PTS2304 TaxID=2283194 RepID=UPI000E0D3D29|nr:YARHG domain-containing protein [Sporosarcina sp. PTS2304]AXH98237.1 YARHG domain-containing protein [Sporosarcina sp. PTS2304]
MRKCLACKEINSDEQEQCTGCGATLSSRRASIKKTTTKKAWPYKILVPIILLIAVAGILAIQNEYSKRTVAEQFVTALIDQDTYTLRELLVPKDSRIEINQDSLQALLTMIEKNPSFVQTIEYTLHTKDEGMFDVRASEKRFGLFPRYTINPTGYIIEVESIGDETILYTDNSEIGYMKHTGEIAEFGPFLAGIYPIKMTTTIEDQSISEEVQANIFGENQTISLFFPSVEEVELLSKDSVEHKTDAEPSDSAEAPVGSIYNDYYILPTSGDEYLKASDLANLSKSELRLARNEIYARYGYIFKSKELQAYFDSQNWYVPNDSYGGSLTDWEKHNVALIKSKE